MQRLLKLRGDQERRRFFAGVAVDDLCETTTAAIVASTGRGWEARFEVASHVVEAVPRETTALYRRLADGLLSPRCGRRAGSEGMTDAGPEASVHPADAVLLAAQLAEVQATAIERLAEIEYDVWPQVLLAGVTDPGLRNQHAPHDARHDPKNSRRDDGTSPASSEYGCYLSLCDAARLAEMTSLNIVDAFPARDMVQEGHGRPLDAIPLWLLLRHAQAFRLLITLRPSPRAIYLPASRDETGAMQIESYELESQQEIVDWLRACISGSPSAASRPLPLEENRGEGASAVSLCGRATMAVDELLFLAPHLLPDLQAELVQLRVLDETSLGISSASLPAACAAILAMLHIDQAPANLPHLTGAAAPRVLGRLTPGNARAWNRLLRELAFVRPLITPLRAAL